MPGAEGSGREAKGEVAVLRGPTRASRSGGEGTAKGVAQPSAKGVVIDALEIDFEVWQFGHGGSLQTQAALCAPQVTFL
jgi:hypothetical protein